MKRLVVVLLAAVLLAGCAEPDPNADGYGGARRGPLPTAPERPFEPPTTPPAPTPPPTCPPDGVLMRAGAADGAAGLRALGITLVNCGRRDYRLDDYPVVRTLDEDHHAVATRVLHGTAEIAGPVPDWNGPPRPIVVRPGRQATCVIVWRSTYDDIRHPPVNAPYLDMRPQSGRAAQLVTPDGALDLGSTGRLGVSPWRLSTPAAPVRPTTAPPTLSAPPPPPPSSIL